MNGTETLPFPRRRLGVLLWCAGTLGAAAVTVGLLPRLSENLTLPGPLWLITVAGVCQSGAIVALAVWGGVALAPGLGLQAPGFEAAARRRPIRPALGGRLLPGFLAGVPGGLLLFGGLRASPAAVAELQGRFTPPLYARVLYGGFTEEILLRWGLMTTFIWLGWRLFQGRRGEVNPALIWIAIVLSAVLFGAGHLPAAFVLIGSLNVPIVLFVIGLNATFGVLFGWLFWRFGLESAMVAHAVTHLVSAVATQAAGAP